MNRLDYLIEYLLKEDPKYSEIQIPESIGEKRNLFRALCNVREPKPIGEEFLRLQDEELQAQLQEKGIVQLSEAQGLQIWQGDITRLKVDAIVNAANSRMLGCFHPLHKCIDNAIHSAAGVQLREECNRLMLRQGNEEPTGQAKITPAFNLPCKYVLHTVGPIVQGQLTKEHEELLESCYRSCLDLADRNGVKSIAFCCISTGVFMFPNERAAEIAVQIVRNYRKEHGDGIEVIFNVWKDIDYEIYRQLLG